MVLLLLYIYFVAQEQRLPCIFIVFVDLDFPTVRYITVVTSHCKHRRMCTRAGWRKEQMKRHTVAAFKTTDQPVSWFNSTSMMNLTRQPKNMNIIEGKLNH